MVITIKKYKGGANQTPQQAYQKAPKALPKTSPKNTARFENSNLKNKKGVKMFLFVGYDEERPLNREEAIAKISECYQNPEELLMLLESGKLEKVKTPFGYVEYRGE